MDTYVQALNYANNSGGVYQQIPGALEKVLEDVLEEGAILFNDDTNTLLYQTSLVRLIKKSQKGIRIGHNLINVYYNGMFIRIGQPWERDYSRHLR